MMICEFAKEHGSPSRAKLNSEQKGAIRGGPKRYDLTRSFCAAQDRSK